MHPHIFYIFLTFFDYDPSFLCFILWWWVSQIAICNKFGVRLFPFLCIFYFMLWVWDPTECYKLRETNISEKTDLQSFGKSKELTIWRASSMPSGHHNSLHISKGINKSRSEDFTEPFVFWEGLHCVLAIITVKIHFKSNLLISHWNYSEKNNLKSFKFLNKDWQN